MRKPLAALFVLLLCTLLNATTIDLLKEDWSVAVTETQQSGKTLFVAFLGDGWSVSSKRFQERILDDPEFKAFASERLVYCPILARSHPKLDKSQTARLQSLVIHLDIKSYPTFILIAPDEREILRHGHREDTAEQYVALLEALLPVSETD